MGQWVKIVIGIGLFGGFRVWICTDLLDGGFLVFLCGLYLKFDLEHGVDLLLDNAWILVVYP